MPQPVRSVRSLREMLADPENTNFWDDDLFADAVERVGGDDDAIPTDVFNERMMRRANEEGLTADQLSDLINVQNRHHIAAGWPKDERHENIADLQKRVDSALLERFPGDYAKREEQRLQNMGDMFPEQEAAQIRLQIRQAREREKAMQGQEQERAAEPMTQPSMRYSGYDIVGRTKQGNKIIKLR